MRKTLTQVRWKLRQKMKFTFTNPRLILAMKFRNQGLQLTSSSEWYCEKCIR